MVIAFQWTQSLLALKSLSIPFPLSIPERRPRINLSHTSHRNDFQMLNWREISLINCFVPFISVPDASIDVISSEKFLFRLYQCIKSFCTSKCNKIFVPMALRHLHNRNAINSNGKWETASTLTNDSRTINFKDWWISRKLWDLTIGHCEGVRETKAAGMDAKTATQIKFHCQLHK